MPDQSHLQQVVEAAQRILRFLVGSTHVTTFRLAWLALLFYAERAVFHNAANRCTWPVSPSEPSYPYQPPVHILLVTDPQIIDRDTYDLPLKSLLYPVVRHFSDNYLKNVWRSLAVNPNRWFSNGYIAPPSDWMYAYGSSKQRLVQPPDGIVWMGDLTDGGRRERSEAEWTALVSRFHNIFRRPKEAHWEAPPSVLSTSRQLIVPRASATDYIPTFHLSGNHDIGLPGTSNSGHRADSLASDDATERFNREFGMKIDGGGFVVKERNPYLRSSLNGRILISTDSSLGAPLGATHELILVNAQDLVGMEREGGGPFDSHLSSEHAGQLDGPLGKAAHAAYKETYEFVESVKQGGIRVPRVLLTHVPLHRPAGSSCDDPQRSVLHGVTRESTRPLHQGTDRGSTYQNMVSSSVTDWVLQSIKPVAVFSGDDHDHCEYRHVRAINGSAATMSVDGFDYDQIPELTVRSISMTEGVRKPGFARLSLFPPPAAGQNSTERYVAMAYTPCLLPDQISIWTHFYLPFFVVSILGLFIWPRLTRSSSNVPAGYLPLNHQRKRTDDDPPMANEREPRHKPQKGGIVQDVGAVIIVALPFWIFCQTHFLF